MKTLHVRHVSLWPRFHLHVQSDIQAGGSVELVETRVPLTPCMRDIQAGLVECIAECIRELKRLNPAMDLEEVDVEHVASTPYLHALLRRLFGSGGLALSAPSRHLVADIKQLASLLKYLVSYDCVSFYSVLKAILAANAAVTGSGMSAVAGSPWLLLDAAQVVFQRAKERVYTTGRPGGGAGGGGALNIILEVQPKLQRCVELILECRGLEAGARARGTRVARTGPILVMVDGDRGVRQLKELLLQRLYEDSTAEDASSAVGGKRTGAQVAPPSHLLRKLLKTYASWNDELVKLLPSGQRTGSAVTPAAVTTTSNAAYAAKRRRVRGSALPQGPAALSSTTAPAPTLLEEGEWQLEEILTQLERAEEEDEVVVVSEGGEADGVDGVAVGGRTSAVDRAFAPPPEPVPGSSQPPNAEQNEPATPDIIIMPYATSSTMGTGIFGHGEQDATLLDRLCPSCVILLDNDLAFVRRLEVGGMVPHASVRCVHGGLPSHLSASPRPTPYMCSFSRRPRDPPTH